MNSSNDNNNNNKELVWEKFKELLNEIPFFIRFIMIIKLLLFLIHILITKNIVLYLSSIPFYVIYRYQFWRLITTSFITTNIINILIGFIIWIKEAILFEKSLGTIRFILIFITNSIFINIIYCVIINFVNSYYNNIAIYSLDTHKLNNSGFWPIIICDMTLLCLNNPNSYIQFLFKPCPIKAKYYPIFIIIIINLVNNFRMSFEIISGVLYAFIYFFLFQNRLYFSDEFIKKIENSFCCKYLIGFGGFINIDSLINYPSSGDVNMISSFDSTQNNLTPFTSKVTQAGSNNDYIAVNEQNQNNSLD